ncbi:hypothetical protein JD844_014036 [Phrynosoma platyrhinos]|uniref:C2H2-type domain-containing protein n=1 Tax=Phrynosoma platyrhinos TaxID=52577 RepID=A0ABQ7SR53_PHRPL|nr:hypothetical protein JD844_014036 [Phrynosoma platyrhinos]
MNLWKNNSVGEQHRASSLIQGGNPPRTREEILPWREEGKRCAALPHYTGVYIEQSQPQYVTDWNAEWCSQKRVPLRNQTGNKHTSRPATATGQQRTRDLTSLAAASLWMLSTPGDGQVQPWTHTAHQSLSHCSILVEEPQPTWIGPVGLQASGHSDRATSHIKPGLSKRPSTSEADGITPKKPKANEMGPGSDSHGLPSIQSPSDSSLLQKDMMHTFLGATKTDYSATSAKTAESESGKLIMLVNDFYYGKHEGNVQQVRQEQKTHTTFKCASCMKLLKSNIRFMNHMKHHLELEKQNSESWENHTTCQHCYRQFPTPFQLQCHIESTHTPHESSTICKICELSFETEQVLLQHMKDNHKPGEMPYVCQKKGVHRCTKCRLQFLTCKEKMDHKSQHHRTFKKPVQLEGLPPGTKVTIRASAGSLQPASTTASPVSANASTLQLSPGAKVASTKSSNNRVNANKAKSKLKPLSIQKKQSLGTSNSSTSSTSSLNSSSGTSNRRTNKIANTALNHLRCPNIQKCIECNSDIRTFASHFPAYVHCSLCRYSTSCSKAYVNHMMRGMTVVCLNCDFLADVSDLDKMAAHLNDNQTHTCQVIIENVCRTKHYRITKVKKNLSSQVKDIPEEAVKDHLSNQSDKAALVTECEEENKATVLANSFGPEFPGGSSDPREGEKTDSPRNQSEEGCSAVEGQETESLPLENMSTPWLQACAKDSAEEGSGGPSGSQTDGSLLAAEGEETVPAPTAEDGPHLELHACSQFSAREGNTEVHASPGGEDPAATGCEESTGPPVLEKHSSSGPCSGSEDPIHTVEKGDPDCPSCQENVFLAAGCEKDILPSALENENSSRPSACAPNSTDAAEGGDANCLSSEGSTLPLGLEKSPLSGPSACVDEPGDAAGEDAEDQAERGNGGLAAACEESPSPSVPETPTSIGPFACSDDPTDVADGGGGDATDCLPDDRDCSQAADGEECLLPSALETEASSVPSSYSNESVDPSEETKRDRLGSEAGEEALSAAHHKDSALVSHGEESCVSECHACPTGSPKDATRDHLGNESVEGEQNVSVGSLEKSTPSLEAQACPEASPHEKAAPENPKGSEELPQPGRGPDGGSHQHAETAVQAQADDLDEAELTDANPDSAELASDDDVSFEQFLRRRGEPDSATSDVSEQGSVHLEPLTPSEVLEHEATEILQKGGVASSTKASLDGSEEGDAPSSEPGSPSPEEALLDPEDGSEEAS